MSLGDSLSGRYTGDKMGNWARPRRSTGYEAPCGGNIVSEYHDRVGRQFWFDEIRVVKLPGVQ